MLWEKIGKIAVIKLRQQKKTFKVEEQRWLLQSHLTSVFYILLSFAVFNCTNCHLGLIGKAPLWWTKWRSTSVHFMKTNLLKYFLWEAQGEKKEVILEAGPGSYYDNAAKAFSCIKQPGGCCPWQGQKGFGVPSLEIYGRRKHWRADGAIQKVMVVTCNLGTSDKHLAASQSAWFPHTCLGNSYHLPLTGRPTEEGRKCEGKICVNEVGSSWVQKVQAQMRTTRLASMLNHSLYVHKGMPIYTYT